MAAILGTGCSASEAATVKVYPAPAGETLSKDYLVRVGGKASPVYVARVAPADRTLRWKAMDDKANSANFYEKASFTYFDMQGTTKVVVTCAQRVTSARILPTSLGIKPVVRGRTVSFSLAQPKPLTLEINGTWVGCLHLFANPPEKDVPKAGDPNVIYFGPGIHEVTRLVVGDNKTVYVAGGAIVRAVIGPQEKYTISSYSGLKTYAPTLELRGRNIKLRGRGIIDATGCTTHARNMVFVTGQDISLEGVILRDASTWNIPVRQSDRVTVRNLKILGYRANSDGIDICNSRDVTVEDCFIRTLDDLIVVKSDKGQGLVKRIVARNCVLWNEVAHALSIGAELSEDVDDVLFTNCDVIHDFGREWSLRVYHCDAATISNVRFEDLRIEEAQRFISLWIGKAYWTRDDERGRIRGVTFRRIRAAGANPLVEFVGFDASHLIEDVTLEDVVVNGKPLAARDVKSNAFVRDVVVKP
ncbi:MAG TPA: glycosyl hydrolase family 28 protein [Armatimonadota bacterium]